MNDTCERLWKTNKHKMKKNMCAVSFSEWIEPNQLKLACIKLQNRLEKHQQTKNKDLIQQIIQYKMWMDNFQRMTRQKHIYA